MALKKHIIDESDTYDNDNYDDVGAVCGNRCYKENAFIREYFEGLPVKEKCKNCSKTILQIDEALAMFPKRFAGYVNTDYEVKAKCFYIYNLTHLGGRSFRITALEWEIDTLMKRNEDNPTIMDQYIDLGWLKRVTLFPNLVNAGSIADIEQFIKIMAL